MRELSAKWVSKCADAVQKRDRVLDLQAILDRFRGVPAGTLNRFVTMDEIWIQTYDPETKERSKD
jgi:hypothetical protein